MKGIQTEKEKNKITHRWYKLILWKHWRKTHTQTTEANKQVQSNCKVQGYYAKIGFISIYTHNK